MSAARYLFTESQTVIQLYKNSSVPSGEFHERLLTNPLQLGIIPCFSQMIGGQKFTSPSTNTW